MEKSHAATPSRGSIRWAILRQAIKVPPPPSISGTLHHSIGTCAKDISRKTPGGFKLISCCPLNGQMVAELQSAERAPQIGRNELFIRYTLPVEGDSELIMIQRLDDCIDLDDFEISNRHDIDTTGLVCCWPSEDALAYFCIENGKMFRSKRVLELGSGYGLAGLAIAANTDAFEVVISDGNPQVIDYVQRNIDINASTFKDSKVKSMILHWSQEHSSEMLNRFDFIIASDCTFFKEFHKSLAQTVKSLLKNSEASEAIFLSPRRGDSLTKFLVKINDSGLDYELVENYNARIWSLHQKLRSEGNSSWPNYDEDHCYPLLLRITFPKTRDYP
ncbi:hypothetical protein KSP40_PGU016378 [Platanthera guangdongensis]|uniref:Calmodulin-lysine N-methyltransferase n=1 Tax=Platanthera guangdongensis TaxID=2320717 RepID=A0ABR2LZS5_9ASPA